MSVEQTGPSGGAKTMATAEGRNGAGKVKAGTSQAAGHAAPGGFMALLAAFDAPDAASNLPGDPAAALPNTMAQPLSVPDKAEVTDVPWAELSMLLGQKMPATQDLAPTDVHTPAGASDLTEAQALAVLQMSINIPLAPGGLPPPDASEGMASRGIGALSVSPQPGGKPMALPDPKETAQLKADQVAVKSAVESLVSDMTRENPVPLSRKAGSSQSVLAANSAAETKVLKLTTFMDLVAKEPALAGALLISGASAEVLNQSARAVGKPVSGAGTPGWEGSFTQHALLPGSSAESAGAAAGAVLSPESSIAEQVTYWVSQGIQNAQLKLEGFGAEPVEVTISLNGQDAQIDFRTDQPEVRQLLEGALTQLKDTLAREGLVLSGVSVGASGQEGAGAQERRSRPNVRHVTVATPEAGPAASLQRSSPVAGRTLDVFV